MHTDDVAVKGTNILSEQNEGGLARIHRLELENRKLSSEIDSLRDAAAKANNEQILNLEQEKKKQSMTIKQLEEMHAQDSEYNVELEKKVVQLEAKNKEMNQVS